MQVNTLCQPALPKTTEAGQVIGQSIRRARSRGILFEREVHRVNLSSFLEALNGKFVGLSFTKLTQHSRKLNGRLGVTKHLKGCGVNTVEREDRPYLTIYDLKNKGYRTVNLSTVTEVRVKNTRYKVLG